MLNEGVW